jgi:transcriptional regulator with XRE-family HTH domain
MIGLEYGMYMKQVNQATLARYLKVTKQVVNYWVLGHDDISENYIDQIEEILEVPKHFLGNELTLEDEIKIDKILLEKKIKAYENGEELPKHKFVTRKKRKSKVKYKKKEFKESTSSKYQDKMLKYLVAVGNSSESTKILLEICDLDNIHERRLANLILHRLREDKILVPSWDDVSESKKYKINDVIFNELESLTTQGIDKGYVFHFKEKYSELFKSLRKKQSKKK